MPTTIFGIVIKLTIITLSYLISLSSGQYLKSMWKTNFLGVPSGTLGQGLTYGLCEYDWHNYSLQYWPCFSGGFGLGGLSLAGLSELPTQSGYENLSQKFWMVMLDGVDDMNDGDEDMGWKKGHKPMSFHPIENPGFNPILDSAMSSIHPHHETLMGHKRHPQFSQNNRNNPFAQPIKDPTDHHPEISPQDAMQLFKAFIRSRNIQERMTSGQISSSPIINQQNVPNGITKSGPDGHQEIEVPAGVLTPYAGRIESGPGYKDYYGFGDGMLGFSGGKNKQILNPYQINHQTHIYQITLFKD